MGQDCGRELGLEGRHGLGRRRDPGGESGRAGDRLRPFARVRPPRDAGPAKLQVQVRFHDARIHLFVVVHERELGAGVLAVAALYREQPFRCVLPVPKAAHAVLVQRSVELQIRLAVRARGCRVTASVLGGREPRVDPAGEAGRMQLDRGRRDVNAVSQHFCSVRGDSGLVCPHDAREHDLLEQAGGVFLSGYIR